MGSPGTATATLDGVATRSSDSLARERTVEREMDYGRLSLSAGPAKRAEISRAPEEQRREGQDRGGHRLRTLPSDRWVNSVAALSCYAICALR
jgi:hypothetical protein